MPCQGSHDVARFFTINPVFIDTEQVDGVLHLYNWNDYISAQTIEHFEA
jgi:hypothetical protein